MQDINADIACYKAQLQTGEIQRALLQSLMAIKAHFAKEYEGQYHAGGIGRGYLDYTYFPFFNEELRKNKLRFGIALNHQKIRHELWLMGQNTAVQEEYWALLKESKWNKDRKTKPQYSVVELTLLDTMDFNKQDDISIEVCKKAVRTAEEIMQFLSL